MNRRTKIVCTLGPSSSDLDTIRELIRAGMDVVRLNFSHGTHDDHARLIRFVRQAADELGKVVPVLQDLQGPKIRIGLIKNGGVLIHKGQHLTLTTDEMEYGNRERVHISYDTLADDVNVGGRILLDDGLLELEVVDVINGDVVTEVVVGGPLRSRKGVNLPDIKTTSPSLTEKDIADLEFGLSMDVDLIALSFVRDESDVTELMSRVRDSGKNVKVLAKIEKPEAVRKIDEILDEADAIMVARGDLGIEMPISRVPGTQKTIIHKCMAAAKPVITATQMLESMIDNPRPTRAEASDVANAVLDGSDAVMLSGETAVGKHPVRVVEVMSQIILDAEQHWRQYQSPLTAPTHRRFLSEDVTESVSYTTYDLAEQVGASAIACLTASGATARAIARHRPSVPLYAFTDDERVMRQLGLLWGTKSFSIPFQRDTDAGVNLVHGILTEKGLVDRGDLIVITAGMPLPAKGRTNMVHVSRI
ncbi:MAG: pyruvate kinase [Rhodothermales bacterium]